MCIRDSNNSLAMVGQGRVQEIVNMKPEERRSLIEEAAGVMKYRNRKKDVYKRQVVGYGPLRPNLVLLLANTFVPYSLIAPL